MPAATDPPARRAVDVAVALLALAVFSPLMALVALLIKLESPGPVFFVQQRVGRNGRRFPMIKFRSMRVAAADEQTVPEVEDIETFKFRPPNLERRQTAIGRAMRACSLDELPNLLNVLRGDLSLVGPRPDEPGLVAQYRPEYHRRHDVRPGITGLAQVNGRNDLTYAQMMAYDLEYVNTRSPARDVQIILKTLGVVLGREGAR